MKNSTLPNYQNQLSAMVFDCAAFHSPMLSQKDNRCRWGKLGEAKSCFTGFQLPQGTKKAPYTDSSSIYSAAKHTPVPIFPLYK
jgi:hypothetical protein